MKDLYAIAEDLEEDDDEMLLLIQAISNVVKIALLSDKFKKQTESVVTFEDFYMILLQTQESEKLLDQCYSSTTLRRFLSIWDAFQHRDTEPKVHLGGSLQYTMKTPPKQKGTSTSTMIATKTTANVGAHLSKGLDLFSTLKAQSSLIQSPRETSMVSSYISATKAGTRRTLSLATESKPFLLKMRCYRIEDLEGIPERDHWKHSYADMTLHFNHQSKVNNLLESLYSVASDEVLAEGGTVWDKRV
jgi:hypothetical protein